MNKENGTLSSNTLAFAKPV